MFDEKTMPVQLRDFRDQLLARDECHSELHGDLLEEDLGEFYRQSRTVVMPPAADEKFNFAYMQVRKANSLWHVGRWDEAAAEVARAIARFDAKPPEQEKKV